MDHNSFGAYGFGDGANYGGNSANTGYHQGWSNWSTGTGAGALPNQQNHQNPYSNDNYGYAQPKGYTAFSGGANFNNFGTFPQKAGSRKGFGYESTSDWNQPQFGGQFGGQFGVPAKKPQKQGNKGQFGMQQQAKSAPKALVTAGKTPTSILHEVFRNITEDYSETKTTPKRYICKLNVDGHPFEGEASNKKSAKHKCSENALRILRPDIQFVAFVETVKEPAPKTPKKVEPAQPEPAKKQKRSAPATKPEEVKKQKLSPVEAASSLFDLMNRIIADSTDTYVPVFEVTETLPPQVKEEAPAVKMEVDDAPKKEKKKKPLWFKDPATIFTVTLKFEEQGRQFQKIGTGRGTQRNLVIREALLDLFNVSKKDIQLVTLRSATQRLNNFSNIATLYSVASTLGCTVNFDVEESEVKPLGDGRPFFYAKCTVISNDDPAKTAHFKSSDSLSKTIAKEQCALLALTQFFELDPSKCKKKEGDSKNLPLGPAATLHTHLQQNNGEIKVDYKFKDGEPKTTPPTFICDCIIGEKSFTATGSSKKNAKNNAAVIALKELFSLDYDTQAAAAAAASNQETSPIAPHHVSKLCRDISEFAKREYHGMCQYYNVRASNQVACFFLVNEKEEKRLIATGSSMQNIVEPAKLHESNGHALVHMDAIVLARRSLIRYLIQELAVLENDPQNSIFVIQNGQEKAELKPNLKILLYTSFPPVCNMSVPDAKIRKLAYVTPISFTPVPDNVMTSAQIRETKEIRVHCTADKIYKWNTIGLQGALLSNLLNPIKLDAIFFGTDAPVSDDSLKFALAGRLSEKNEKLQLESIANQMRSITSYSHCWTRGIDSVEKLDHTLGLTHDGNASKYSKFELFQSYLKLNRSDSSINNYAAAKQKAETYQNAKTSFYNKLEQAGLGKWQTKPSDFLDNFNVTVPSE